VTSAGGRQRPTREQTRMTRYDAPSYDVGLAPSKHAPRVTIDDLPRWCDDSMASTTSKQRAFDADESDAKEDGVASTTPKFGVRNDLNARVRVYAEDFNPWLLAVDCVTTPANEALQRQYGKESVWQQTLHETAGVSLENEMRATSEKASTGGTTVTSGHRLPARRIMHTVGPRYAEKYATASENALCHCYVSALTKAVDECGMRSIAITPACIESKGYPVDMAAMVCVRTVRRFLERYPKKLDAVVFCVDADSREHHIDALATYFPRNASELARSMKVLKDKECNEYGELVIDERRMRIDAFPGRKSPINDTSQSGFNRSAGVRLDDADASVLPAVSSVFMSMSIDPESRRQRQQMFNAEVGDDTENWWQVGTPSVNTFSVPGANVDTGLTVEDRRTVEEEQKQRTNLLKRAQSMDVSDVSDAKAIYLEKHRDYIGRRIVVVVAAYLERLIKAGEEQKLLAHVAKELSTESVTNNPRGYVIVYHHAGGAYGAPPSLDFIRKLHVALGPQHKDTLKCVFVIHPTAVLKAAIWTMDVLQLESRLFKKVEYVDTICDLHEYVRLEDVNAKLEVPGHVDDYDRELVLNPPLW
jgi:O-acetyl-ADP-ribose deacetylase (regulator of RNase III)